MKLFEELYLIRLSEIVRQTYAPDDPIKSEQDVLKALLYVSQMMQKLEHKISREHLQDDLDQYLPGTRIAESNEDIKNYNSNLTLINQRLNLFLENNPASFIQGIDVIRNRVIIQVNAVRADNAEPMTETTRQLINTFRTILGVFNRMVSLIDDHNAAIRPDYRRHDQIIF